jgi:hypothetical protein
MDTELEQYYLDKDRFTDKQIEEEREKKYWYYRGKLNDFRSLFEKQINDVEFEVMFEKLMDGYLNYRVLNLVNSYRQLHKGFEPYLDDSGNIKSEFTTEKYKDSLTHNDDELVSDEEE